LPSPAGATPTPVPTSVPTPAPAAPTPTPTSGSGGPSPVPAGIAFVQVNSAVPQSNQSSVSIPYTQAQTTHNTNVLAIGWNDATSNITAVRDSAGNVYQQAVATARGAGVSQAIYYAANIKAAAAGANTVTVTFDHAVPFADVRILEYSGLNTTAPFNAGTSAAGSGGTAATPAVTTASASEILVGAGITTGGFGEAGSGYTTRVITQPDEDIVEDRIVSTTGSYSATAPVSGNWVMQVAAFKP
jgi:hypothetical protein